MTTPSTAYEYSSNSSADYALRRNYAASARLNLQHYQHKECLGYLLHPSIALRPGMKVADVATGTGIWLLNLASSAPEDCFFEGWDISNAQYPHESNLPENVKFGILDGMGTVPKSLLGKYDIVHVGLLALVVRDGNPAVWIANLMAMLKPGGYLQWMEGDVPRYISRIKAQGSDPSKFPNMYALEQLHVSQMEKATSASSIKWITELMTHFGQAGLQDVKYIPYDVDSKYWRAWTETLFLILDEMAFQMKQPTLKEIVGKAGEELVLGAVNPTLMPIVCVGRKPL